MESRSMLNVAAIIIHACCMQRYNGLVLLKTKKISHRQRCHYRRHKLATVKSSEKVNTVHGPRRPDGLLNWLEPNRPSEQKTIFDGHLIFFLMGPG